MHEPTRLATEYLQSDDFVPHDENGKGGRGWRLSKNGDMQIGDTVIREGTLRLSEPQLELGFDMTNARRPLDLVYLTQEQIDAAKCDLPAHIVHKPGASRAHQVMVTQCDLEVVVRIDLPEGVDPVNAEGYAHKIRQIVMDTIDSSEALQGMRSGRITAEATVRAETDSALASRIGGLAGVGMGLDLDGQVRYFGEKTRDPIIGTATGKEYLYVKQPGGPVAIGDLQKCCGRDTFTEQFLNREVRSDLKPEVACALSMAAPMTANGKVPINNLPRPVDDDQ